MQNLFIIKTKKQKNKTTIKKLKKKTQKKIPKKYMQLGSDKSKKKK